MSTGCYVLQARVVSVRLWCRRRSAARVKVTQQVTSQQQLTLLQHYCTVQSVVVVVVRHASRCHAKSNSVCRLRRTLIMRRPSKRERKRKQPFNTALKPIPLFKEFIVMEKVFK